jgi:hypothetical protein
MMLTPLIIGTLLSGVLAILFYFLSGVHIKISRLGTMLRRILRVVHQSMQGILVQKGLIPTMLLSSMTPLEMHGRTYLNILMKLVSIESLVYMGIFMACFAILISLFFGSVERDLAQKVNLTCTTREKGDLEGLVI